MKGSKSTKGFLKHFMGHHIFVSMKEDQSKPPIHYHNGYDKAEVTLQGKNEADGIFFTVNLLDETLDEGRHRTKKMVVKCRAIFMDDDIPRKEPRDDFPLSPSLIVETSSGKFHYYWLIDNGTLEKEEWQSVQNGLISLYEGDSNAKDLTRYLRLPGYKHNKKKAYWSTWSGDGSKYTWKELLEAFPPQTNVVSIKSEETSSESKSVEAHFAAIADGSNYHGSIISLTHQMKSDGSSNAMVISTLKLAMSACSAKLKSDDRWINRFNDIERDVKSYVPETGNVELPDDAPVVIKHNLGEFPWPPGMLGDLAQIAYDNQLYQHREIAVVSAVGLVAGVCGRKFNFHRNGLNVYLTLIMRTGGGKDAIGDFISGVLNRFAPLGKQSSFVGSQRFTGPKSVINSLENALCQVCVFSEAGLLLKSKAGDRAGLSRMLLSLYSKSAEGKWSGKESFSNDENDIKSMPSPSLTIVNEATPETLLDALATSGALEKGELPRQSIYRADKDKPKPNPHYGKMGYDLSEAMINRITELVKVCAAIQAESVPKVWHMHLDDNISEAANDIMTKYRNVENSYAETDQRRSIMASRAAVKVMKFAAIAAVFNGQKDLTIYKPEWDWAEAMVEYEMKGLDFFFQGSGGNEFDEIVRSYLGNQIWKIIKGKAGKSVRQSDAKQRQQGIFPFSGLRAICRTSNKIATIGDDLQNRSKPVDGLHKMMDYMIMAGLLIDISVKGDKLYKITQDFRNMMYYENK